MPNYSRQPWWLFDPEDETVSGYNAACYQLVTWVNNFDTYQAGRSYDLFRYASLYANRDMLSLARTASDPYLPSMPSQIINRTKAAIDTLVGRQIQDESRAVFNVTDGDFEDHDKAQKLERFIAGEMYRTRAYETCRLALRDAAWAGDGWVHGYIKKKKPYFERVLPMEMILDEAAAVSEGDPRELYRRRYMPRQYVIERYPDKEEEIRMLPVAAPPYFWPATDSDMVMLYEGWHLPDDENENGRHIVGCGSVCILDEEYKKDHFPFARVKWCSTPIGGYSLGLVEELLPLHLELDMVTRRLQAAIRLFAVPRIWQQAGTKISSEYNNMIGNVYKFAGMKPEIDSGSGGVPAILFEREQQLLELLDAQAGVSKMELTGDVPSHTDSRPALREVQEIAAGRRDWISKKWQELCARDMAELIIDTARDVVKKYGSYKAQGRAKQFIEEIDFKEIDMENDRFQIQVQPASLLPNTVAGKRMVAGDLIEKGLIQDPNDLWEMLSGMPDVDEMRRLKTASRRLAERQITVIKQQKTYIPPVETQDVAYAKKLAQDELNYLLTLAKVPDSVIETLHRFVFECDQINAIMTMPPPAPPAMPAAAAPPGATGLGAPQTSPVPNPAAPPMPVPPVVG